MTIDGERYGISPVFSVFATQNPIEYEGTYPLPEAQLDRFMLKIILDFPRPPQEMEILALHDAGFDAADFSKSAIGKVLVRDEILPLRSALQEIKVEEKIHKYIVDIVQAARRHPNVAVGPSPRGSIFLMKMARASACMQERDFAVPDDVKENAPDVLRHRLILKPEAQIEGIDPDDIITEVLKGTAVPM